LASKGHKNNLNLFDAKSYRHPTGDGALQICMDLARIALNSVSFCRISPMTSQVHTIAHLFNRPYAVRDYPKKPPTSLPYKHLQPPSKSVKTRRKSLVSNKVYLQMAGSTRGRDGLTIQGLETCTCCITEVRGEETKKTNIYKGKEEKVFNIMWLCHFCASVVKITCETGCGSFSRGVKPGSVI
jgi:hypothetical protein